ncbi:MAG: hypothetical protein JRD68_14780 [Deltaproteobacteria bacterium]|nr:hypothetical protein [Deltaproteobacteria bacterium]
MIGKIVIVCTLTVVFLASYSAMPLVRSDTVSDSDTTSNRRVERIGEIEYPAIGESSGLAASIHNHELLWTHNDSGSKPRLYAMNYQGEHLAAIHLKGASNHDWEDMASFRFQGAAYLLIADIGDNRARRPDCTLYVVREPLLDSVSKVRFLEIDVAWKINFSYEDGPRDAEAVAVDPATGQILILSKRNVPPVLYSLPMRQKSGEPLVAKRLATLSNIPGPAPPDLVQDLFFGRYRNQPTAMDISRDGKKVLVATYTYAYLFSRKSGQTWLEAFTKPPSRIPLPRRRQGESVCFTPDGSGFIIGSEKRPSPLWRIWLTGQE